MKVNESGWKWNKMDEHGTLHFFWKLFQTDVLQVAEHETRKRFASSDFSFSCSLSLALLWLLCWVPTQVKWCFLSEKFYSLSLWGLFRGRLQRIPASAHLYHIHLIWLLLLIAVLHMVQWPYGQIWPLWPFMAIWPSDHMRQIWASGVSLERAINIARGTTDPGYRVYNLSYLSS